MSDNSTQPNGAIRLKGVTKNYHLGKRVVPALKGIDLEIIDPGFYAIMGPSGSGKSTLLHLLAALDRPDAGSIELDGVRIDTLNETQLTQFRRHQIGIVFQQYNLISTMSALDNVTLPALLDGMPRKQRYEKGMKLLESLGLTDRADHRPDALSGGEQQRIAIGRAILFEPSILFADEPTGNLDSETSEQVWKLLHDLANQQDMTVIMVTHEPVAAMHCEKAFILRDGRILRTIDIHDGIDIGELATRLLQPDG
ncbi:MAG: ABC transporter ATP-binding protein [Planctomycetota bacterium]|nr:ABC transporter ATP-binding protein [Planctomycetota bacterium]